MQIEKRRELLPPAGMGNAIDLVLSRQRMLKTMRLINENSLDSPSTPRLGLAVSAAAAEPLPSAHGLCWSHPCSIRSDKLRIEVNSNSFPVHHRAKTFFRFYDLSFRDI